MPTITLDVDAAGYLSITGPVDDTDFMLETLIAAQTQLLSYYATRALSLSPIEDDSPVKLTPNPVNLPETQLFFE